MAEIFREEQPHLQPLPVSTFQYFRQATRTVDDAGLMQIDSSYYAALPAIPHSEVTVRIFEHGIEILDAQEQLLRRHAKAARKGSFALEGADRIGRSVTGRQGDSTGRCSAPGFRNSSGARSRRTA